MLNPFPIQFLALLAYFILRVFVGSLLLFHANKLIVTTFKSALPNKKLLCSLGLFEFCIAVAVILGYYTQYAMIGLFFFSFYILLFLPTRYRTYFPDKSYWTLMIGISLTLFITGAGVFAFDLPI